MRLISQLPKREKLVVSEERLNALKQYVTEEIEDAFSSRYQLDQEWHDLMRQYEGVPMLEDGFFFKLEDGFKLILQILHPLPGWRRNW